MLRFSLIALLFALFVAATSTTLAEAADPSVQRLTFENEVDPGLSAQFTAACGFPIQATVTGAVVIFRRTNQNGITHGLQLQRYEATYTNLATGESVTLRAANQITAFVTASPGVRVHEVRLQGLNFVYLAGKDTVASAGQRDLLLVFTLDEDGDVIDVDVTMDDTPNLIGLASFLCPRLAP